MAPGSSVFPHKPNNQGLVSPGDPKSLLLVWAQDGGRWEFRLVCVVGGEAKSENPPTLLLTAL